MKTPFGPAVRSSAAAVCDWLHIPLMPSVQRSTPRAAICQPDFVHPDFQHSLICPVYIALLDPSSTTPKRCPILSNLPARRLFGAASGRFWTTQSGRLGDGGREPDRWRESQLQLKEHRCAKHGLPSALMALIASDYCSRPESPRCLALSTGLHCSLTTPLFLSSCCCINTIIGVDSSPSPSISLCKEGQCAPSRCTRSSNGALAPSLHPHCVRPPPRSQCDFRGGVLVLQAHRWSCSRANTHISHHPPRWPLALPAHTHAHTTPNAEQISMPICLTRPPSCCWLLIARRVLLQGMQTARHAVSAAGRWQGP